MLVRADAIPVVEMVKAAEAIDAEAAALWLHMGLWDSLGEMIDDARPEIDAVWKSVVAAKSDRARRVLVRQALERRVDGDEIDDVVKAAAGLSLVRGYVAKEETPEQRRAASANEPRMHGRWTKQEQKAYDALAGLTTPNDGLQQRSKDVATALNDRDNAPYTQMRVAGNALIATGNTNAMAAGGAARVAAEVGPSVEDVLGPHLRRIAYRYRGTEKRPDGQLVRETKEAQAYVAGLNATPSSDAERQYQANIGRQLEDRRPGEWGKGAVAYRMAQAQGPGQHVSEDQIEMRATGDIATAHLMRQLPTDREAFLSQEAGRTPPSIGVMIDRDGDVVSEAMGYQGDHYLPFDLKNLKRLHGGSYVRTRALGGPTSEDIYTGLLTGARQMTVISRSGVFTVEFDPDLRGGRRYSDKARQMIDRYSRLLDVVAGGKDYNGEDIYFQDISESEKRAITAAALKDTDYDEKEAEVIIQRRLKQARARAKTEAQFSEDDLDAAVDNELRDWIRNQTASQGHAPSRTDVGRAREDLRRDVLGRMRESKTENIPQKLRLNADGYFRAMQSLRREFPYFIRGVDYESLPEFEERRATRQRGEHQMDFGAPGRSAARAHVSRRGLVTGDTERQYPRIVGTRATTVATESADEAAGGEGGEKTKERAAAGGKKLKELLKDEGFQERIAGLTGVFNVALETHGEHNLPIVPDPLAPAEGGQWSREKAIENIDSADGYVKWFAMKYREPGQRAKFLAEEAKPEELKQLSDGLKTINERYADISGYPSEKFEQMQNALYAINGVQESFGELPSDLAAYKPAVDNPKPAAISEVVNNMGDREDFDKVKTRWINAEGPAMEAAFIAADLPDKTVAADIRKKIRQIEAVKEWAKARQEVAPGKVAPKPDALIDLDITGTEADDFAKDPKSWSVYKDLVRLQRAWAWTYANRLLTDLKEITGGGATPKAPQRRAIEGPTEKRLQRRRVVYLDREDLLSKAFARRLNR